jgi:Cu/Ag efflux protein CusF
MKKVTVVLVVVLSLCLVASLAFASAKGTIKSVDAKAGSVVITVDGKDATFKADKGVDLGKVKAGDKVDFTADKDVVTQIKAAAKKAAVGC